MEASSHLFFTLYTVIDLLGHQLDIEFSCKVDTLCHRETPCKIQKNPDF